MAAELKISGGNQLQLATKNNNDFIFAAYDKANYYETNYKLDSVSENNSPVKVIQGSASPRVNNSKPLPGHLIDSDDDEQRTKDHTPKRRYSDGDFKMEELPKYLDVEERKIITELNNEIMKSDTS